MIVVRITLNVFPEKHLELMQTLLSIAEPTQKDEGCLTCEVFCDMQDKNRLRLLQEWRDREDLDYHMMSNRFSVLLGTNTLLSEPLEIRIDTVTRTEGMEAVAAARGNKASQPTQRRLFS